MNHTRENIRMRIPDIKVTSSKDVGEVLKGSPELYQMNSILVDELTVEGHCNKD